MNIQPLDEQNNVQNTNEYIILKTSQSSKNVIPDSVPIFNFSSIINPVNDISPNTEDSNGIGSDLSTSFDEKNKIDRIMNDVQSKLGNMSCDEWFDHLINELEENQLKSIDQSIKDREMSVKIQPPTDIRRRYESENKRHIEKSRSKPMTINLPNLKECKLDSDQSFLLQFYLTTTNENPSKKIYSHPYKLEYHDDNLPTSDHKLARVLLTPEDIKKGIKELPCISIIKKLLREYTFELKPFDPLPTNNKIEIYENKYAKGVVDKAKAFRDEYNLTSSRIVVKLLIKQDKTWHMTDIKCETDIMKEDETKPNKRSASSATIDDDDEYQVYRPNPLKKQKSSRSLINSKPKTRVKISSTY